VGLDHIREGKHGAGNWKQAIAIGLSKARSAGAKLAPPKKGQGIGPYSQASGSRYSQRIQLFQASFFTEKIAICQWSFEA
jgi:hypothetical protein